MKKISQLTKSELISLLINNSTFLTSDDPCYCVGYHTGSRDGRGYFCDKCEKENTKVAKKLEKKYGREVRA